MDIPVYRLIDLARLLFFRALLLEAERRRDVSPSTSAHDTLQTARTHRRRAARRGRGVRPTGTPLSAHGFDSRQRAVDLRPMPDLCGQRARRGRLFAFDANGELIETPTPAGDASFSRGAAGSSRGAVPPLTEIVSSDLLDSPFPERGVQSPKRPVPSALLDPLFPERPMPSAAWDVHAAVRDVLAPAEDVPSLERAARSSRRAMQSPKRSAPSAKGAVPPLTEIVSSDLLDSPFPERVVQSPKRSVPSKTVDGLGASEARYAALVERSAQTADRLLRRVSRHRAKGK